jgi:hypothetical protein
MAVTIPAMWFLTFWNWFVEEICNSLEKWARESLQCYKQSVLGNFGGVQKTRIPIEKKRVKARLLWFQAEMRILSRIGIEAINITF